jgi:asparagine synthase (glutamine-hydrolysing)
MPGIVGIISKRPAEQCQRLVKSMIACLEHERFYTSGTHFEPYMGVYVGWVAMDQSFAAGQVFFNEERNIALIFSGECFVDTEIGTQLKQKGHNVGKNKAEWLVHLYEEENDQFFTRLNGFFSGLLIDRKTGRAVLFNDRYGLDRLYIHESEEAIYFASEAKALLRVLPELREFDTEGVAQFLTFGCTLEQRTLFRNVQLLPGASLWSFEERSCRKTKYFSAESWESQQPLSTESFISEFEQTFKRVLPRYFDSESGIGISLTAGLDTRMIMACLPRARENAVCYTYSGQAADTLDARLAARVAAACGLEHRVLRIRPDFLSNFQAHADRTVYTTDGCFGISGAHEIYMSEQARSLSSVRLTGVFGGEVLRGVSTFKPLGLCRRLFGAEMQSLVKPMAEGLRSTNGNPVTFAAFKEIPWNLFGTVMACRSQLSFRSPYLDNDLMALAYRAPLSLRHSPVPALRVVRNNSQALSDIPTDMGHLGKASGLFAWWGRMFSRLTFKLDYLNNEGWPHWLSLVDPLFGRFAASANILGLHKHLHYRSWFRHELARYVNNILTDPRIRNIPFWDSEFVKQMAADHTRGRKNYVLEINAVLTLEAVERLLFRDLPYSLEGAGDSDIATISSQRSNKPDAVTLM